MSERVLGYNVNARLQYKLPVLSIVFHLMDDTALPVSPLLWTVPLGDEIEQEVLGFKFHVIELSQYTPEEIWSLGHEVLVPMLPLTQGGIQRKNIEKLMVDLEHVSNPDLKTVGIVFVTLKLRKQPEELAWFVERYKKVLTREFWEQSPFIQEILQTGHKEGYEEGREEGLEEGLKKGQLMMASGNLIDLVRSHFPALLPLAEKRVPLVRHVDALQQAFHQILVLKDDQEQAQAALLALPIKPEEKGNSNTAEK
jgi:hypothetical protein